MKIHFVKQGDTLATIGEKYGFTADELLAANRQLENPDRLTPGAKIRIPTKPALIRSEQVSGPSTSPHATTIADDFGSAGTGFEPPQMNVPGSMPLATHDANMMPTGMNQAPNMFPGMNAPGLMPLGAYDANMMPTGINQAPNMFPGMNAPGSMPLATHDANMMPTGMNQAPNTYPGVNDPGLMPFGMNQPFAEQPFHNQPFPAVPVASLYDVPPVESAANVPWGMPYPQMNAYFQLPKATCGCMEPQVSKKENEYKSMTGWPDTIPYSHWLPYARPVQMPEYPKQDGSVHEASIKEDTGTETGQAKTSQLAEAPVVKKSGKRAGRKPADSAVAKIRKLSRGGTKRTRPKQEAIPWLNR